MLRFHSCLPINDLSSMALCLKFVSRYCSFPVRILQDPCPTGKYYRPYVRDHQAD